MKVSACMCHRAQAELNLTASKMHKKVKRTKRIIKFKPFLKTWTKYQAIPPRMNKSDQMAPLAQAWQVRSEIKSVNKWRRHHGRNKSSFQAKMTKSSQQTIQLKNTKPLPHKMIETLVSRGQRVFLAPTLLTH